MNWVYSWHAHALYVLMLLAWALSVPREMLDPASHQFILLISVLAAWRYGWALLNWLRFLFFKLWLFPRWRRKADAVCEDELPSHVYLLVTSFRIGTETSRRVYRSVFEEAQRYVRPVTVVASIVERCDEVLIKQLFQPYQNGQISLRMVRIAGTGKRDALAYGFRSISKHMPAPNDVVAVIDGDSMLSENTLRRTVPFFAAQPDMGALTTDEICEVEGAWSFREWYNLRFAQRHVYMASASVSRRVLTLTGRMSMFRASIVTDPEFIRRVELDWIDHWRLGRFKFLTGDDKSSWFHLMSRGIPMIYVPDVQVLTIETPPDPHFLRSAHMLMKRWSGNMLRNNARALKLSWRKTGVFPWFMILDQRLSMWTSLTSPSFALLGTFFVNPAIAAYYFLWIALSRYLLTLSLLASRPHVSAAYPFFLYFNQIFGSFIKTMVFFQLDQQKWTRQNTVLNKVKTQSQPWHAALLHSRAMHALSLASLLVTMGTITGMMRVPSVSLWLGMIG